MKDSAVLEQIKESGRDELQAFFDERIDGMSTRELNRFEKKADEIAERVKRREHGPGEPSGNAQSELKASRA